MWMSDVCELEPSSFETRVKWMARSEVVEVSVPFVRESVGWAARLFPWENALGLLTRPFREDTAPFTVFRHLSAKKARLADKRPGSLLIVRSGPGEIGSRYELDRECQMVTDALRPALPAGSDTLLPNPIALHSRARSPPSRRPSSTCRASIRTRSRPWASSKPILKTLTDSCSARPTASTTLSTPAISRLSSRLRPTSPCWWP